MFRHQGFWVPSAVVMGIILGVVMLNRDARPREWGQGIDDPDPAIRAAAIRELPPIEIAGLVNLLLQDESADVRLLAANRLWWDRDSGTKATETLVSAFRDPDAGVRRTAAESLGHMGPSTWPFLQAAMRNEDPRLRAGAALAVASVYSPKDDPYWTTSKADEIIPVLTELMDDPDPEVRRQAERALAEVTEPRAYRGK